MKVIAIKLSDNIKFIHPNINIYGPDKAPYSQCKALQAEITAGNTEWYLIDSQLIPSSCSVDSRDQLYFDPLESGVTGTSQSPSIRIDLDWSVQLMPKQLIKSKELTFIKAEIEAALAESPADITTATIKQNELQNLQDNDDELFWYQKALTNLSRAVKDITTIQPKIEAKIAELSA